MYEIDLVVGAETLVLHGPGVSGAVKGSRLLEGGSRIAPAGETITESIETLLEGTEDQVLVALGNMARLLRLARESADQPNGVWGYLAAAPVAGGTWRSKIVDGWLEFSARGNGTRARGRVGVVVKVVRENWWEGDEASLALSNVHGLNVTTGLTWTNHNDSGHQNIAYTAATAILGDQRSPARLDLALTTTSTGTLWVGMNQDSDPANLPVNYQGESGAPGAGVTGTVAADANASNGQRQELAWSGSSATTLASWALTAANVARMMGRSFWSVLRFSLAPTESTIWAWWRLCYTGSAKETVWEGAGQYITTSELVQELGGLDLPPWRFPAGLTAPALTLELMVKGGAGAHALTLDEFYLLPQDGWRKYIPILATVQGLGIQDDSARGNVLALANTLQTHAAEGPGFWLQPGKAALFAMLLSQGNTLNTATVGTVKVMYRARRAVL